MNRLRNNIHVISLLLFRYASNAMPWRLGLLGDPHIQLTPNVGERRDNSASMGAPCSFHRDCPAAKWAPRLERSPHLLGLKGVGVYGE